MTTKNRVVLRETFWLYEIIQKKNFQYRRQKPG